MDHSRDPCPWVIISDFGGAFSMGVKTFSISLFFLPSPAFRFLFFGFFFSFSSLFVVFLINDAILFFSGQLGVEGELGSDVLLQSGGETRQFLFPLTVRNGLILFVVYLGYWRHDLAWRQGLPKQSVRRAANRRADGDKGAGAGAGRQLCRLRRTLLDV